MRLVRFVVFVLLPEECRMRQCSKSQSKGKSQSMHDKYIPWRLWMISAWVNKLPSIRCSIDDFCWISWKGRGVMAQRSVECWINNMAIPLKWRCILGNLSSQDYSTRPYLATMPEKTVQSQRSRLLILEADESALCLMNIFFLSERKAHPPLGARECVNHGV